MPVHIRVVEGDALAEPCDVLVLKYAQENYGVDYEVAHALLRVGVPAHSMRPRSGGFRIHESRGAVAARYVMFVGVEPLERFDYNAIVEFASKSLRDLAGHRPDVTKVAYTVHGPGYGLDEIESFGCLITGLDHAVGEQDYPPGLTEIRIVERNHGRSARLKEFLSGYAPDGVLQALPYKPPSSSKDRAFVAMPFTGKEDHFHYGIQKAVRDAGMICERIDQASFVGDIVDQIKARIASAQLVVADISGKNPNVFLEVGYAWGKGIPTVLLVDDVDDLAFDVRGQRCLVYSDIRDLEAKLSRELSNLAQAPTA